MSITNEFNWYVNNTKVYPNKINNAVDIILSNSQNPNNCFIENIDYQIKGFEGGGLNFKKKR